MFDTTIIQPHHVSDKHCESSADPLLVDAFNNVIQYLARHEDLTDAEKANYADTAVRAAKAFADMTATRTEINQQLASILATGFPMDKHEGQRPGMIVQGPIEITSFCPHHLLPVSYEAFVAYLPQHGGSILGISKLARIAVLLGRRPVLQEQLSSDIADVLSINNAVSTGMSGITSAGSAVMLVGQHSCMSCRGVRSNALTATPELRGDFWASDMESKFLAMIANIRASKL